MTHRIFDKHAQAPAYISFVQVWHDVPGYGKFNKKRLHKALRRAAQEEIAYELGECSRLHERGLSHARSEVNWRTW